MGHDDSHDDSRDGDRPGLVEHAVSALTAVLGDYLAETDNPLHQPLAFYRHNRPLPPGDVERSPSGKVCVLLHGLGCNESLWRYPAPHPGGDFGEALQRDHGYLPLYVRFNSGERVSTNGRAFAELLQALALVQGDAMRELVLIGHSMGGLLMRSACHYGDEHGHSWMPLVSHSIYLGSPHLGAPLEKATNVATNVLGLFDTTATRVIGDLLNTRSAGVKDLRYGNLLDEDWLNCDPDELLNNRRVPVPWLASARHHRVVGQLLPGAATVGDAMVRPQSAAGQQHGNQPGAPTGGDVQVVEGLPHLTLARHPRVYEVIERWVREDG